ncbi:MAG: hypothetical protein HYU65_06435 [Armatimonadetes bacterium]|nr:hypothetical protein [Armatimonadota bacterium]
MALEVYRLTERFLGDDPDGLAAELRRAALTVTGKLAAHHSGLPPKITEFRDAAKSTALKMDVLLVGAMDDGQISNEAAERLRRGYQQIALSLIPNRRKRS